MNLTFDIPEPKMPTPEEHRAVSLKWLASIQPTLIDQWPKEVLALSMPTAFISVPDGLLEEFYGLHDGNQPGPIMNEVADRLDAKMGWDRKFIRLNSRSPKDWLWPFEAPITMSGKEALSFMASSERVLDDLLEFKYVPEQPASMTSSTSERSAGGYSADFPISGGGYARSRTSRGYSP